MIRRLLSSTNMSKLGSIRLLETGGAGVIQLNRPEALNALTLEMFREARLLIQRFEHEKDVVIFKGLGKVFCAGGDVKQSAVSSLDTVTEGYINSSITFNTIANYSKPFVALVDGLAMGGAAIFALPGKFRIATERTSFSMPETAIGYFNDAGASYFLSRLEDNFGLYMGMTGTRVTGYDMKKTNLASHFVLSSRLDELEKKLVECKTFDEVDETLNAFSSEPQSTETELDSIMPRIKKCFSGASVEEIYKNLDEDGSEWAMKTIKTLNKMSPTSLKVTHRSINLGKNMSIIECFKMEKRLVIRHIIDSDFKEGVRAVLRDKDFKPKWNPKTLEEVTDDRVAKFFEPLSDADELSFEKAFTNKL